MTLRVAVAGKGGSGKSVVAGTLARVLARRGESVLALDSDFMPGLAYSLGAEQPAEPPLLDAAEQDEQGRWRLKRGIGPVRAIERFSTEAPDGVRLLQPGKLSAAGLQPIMPAVQAYYLACTASAKRVRSERSRSSATCRLGRDKSPSTGRRTRAASSSSSSPRRPPPRRADA